MICPYMPCSCVTRTLRDPDNDKVLYETKNYKASNCMKDDCPFYSNGDGEYMSGVCIRAEKEKEQ